MKSGAQRDLLWTVLITAYSENTRTGWPVNHEYYYLSGLLKNLGRKGVGLEITNRFSFCNDHWVCTIWIRFFIAATEVKRWSSSVVYHVLNVKTPLKAGFLSRSLICSGWYRHRCRKCSCHYQLLLRDNVSCWRTFGTILNRELNLLPFVQRFVIVTLNSRKMYEHIFATVCGRNEAEAFFRVKPFY